MSQCWPLTGPFCGATQGPCSFMEADQGPMSTEVWSFDVMGSLTHPTQS